MNTATCKKCGVEHDIRDMRNGVCFWCEQKEEKKKEEQTKCDAKSQEVKSLIEETNKEFESLESNFLKFVGLEEDKEFSQSISNLKDELKKLKKAIKEFE